MPRAVDRVLGADLGTFAVPHFVVDDLFSEELVAAINHFWPDYEEFTPEIAGNKTFGLTEPNYLRLGENERRFWQAFNELLWPEVVAASAAVLAPAGAEIFQDLYTSRLCPDTPVTLMQAHAEYHGHSMHTHFYHCPHWAFTMLLYIDPEDTVSRGTALHRLLPRDDARPNSDTSYRPEDAPWRVDVSMDSHHWKDAKIPDRRYADRTIEYKANRLFVLLDGPLALHSVPYDREDFQPDERRALDEGRHARRRIVRQHVKVDNKAFFARFSPDRDDPIPLDRFGTIMAPDAALSADDAAYLKSTLRPFFEERFGAYIAAGAAVEASHDAETQGGGGTATRRDFPFEVVAAGFRKYVY